MKNIYVLFTIVCGLIMSCSPEIDEFEMNKGEADFSKYIAIGNSLTAGTGDAVLYKSGQMVAYPNLIAQQLKFVGGGDFKQPIVESEFGLIFLTPTSPLDVFLRSAARLTIRAFNSDGSPKIEYMSSDVTKYDIWSRKVDSDVNNFGVPGITLKDLFSPSLGDITKVLSASVNLYYVRFAKTPSTPIIDAVVDAKPTFFSLWIGSNDVLGYAVEGGKGKLTPAADFQVDFKLLIDKLLLTKAKGIVATVPNILATPHFQYLTKKVLAKKLTKVEADDLNSAYKLSAAGLGITSSISFKEGTGNFLVVQDALLGFRHIKPGELILLSASDAIKAGAGYKSPLMSKLFLDLADVEKINKLIIAYNITIKELVKNSDFALLDTSEMFKRFNKGVNFSGISFSADFITGNIFSLDGLHFSGIGNALVANFFIESINAKYNSTIPKLDLTMYKGIILP